MRFNIISGNSIRIVNTYCAAFLDYINTNETIS